MPAVSFEVFPPANDDGLRRLAAAVGRLRTIAPEFVSVTYGAGGSERHRSFAAIRVVADGGVEVAGHLTCVGQPVAEIDAVMDGYEELGVRRIVALRGDPPAGVDAPYEPHPAGYRRTADLVAAAKERHTFDIAVSAYPERHPQSPSDAHDLDVLAEKVAAGADRAITQMFFDNACFERYLERVRSRGIEIPIVPGIFPIHSYPTVARFAARCGATIPDRVAARFAGLDDDPAATQRVAAELAAEQITGLAGLGVEHVHLYTLNRSELALTVCELVDAATSGRLAVGA